MGIIAGGCLISVSYMHAIQFIRRNYKHYTSREKEGKWIFNPGYFRSSKAKVKSRIGDLPEFQQKNLVKLLGFFCYEYVLMLVYVYMPENTLERHLFHWKEEGLNPLSWKQRLCIALEVAEGME
ncbi:hypothetical protein Droror1_Dr00022529 [Drosera rotundifolia]